MPTDPNDTNDKELVLTAISALKARGAEINAHTVAQEAQISRSRLYRDNEIMELITEEGSNSNGGAEMAEDNAQKRIAELEARIIELEETIWNLEKAAETFEKKQQDAYHSGFQKGMEEATRRYTSQSHLVDSAKVDDEQFTISPMTFGSFEERAQGDEMQVDTGPLPTVPAMNSLSLSDSEFIYEPPIERQLRPASLPFELDFSSPDMSDFPAADDGIASSGETAAGNHDESEKVQEVQEEQEEKIPRETVVKTGDYEPYRTDYSFKPEETPEEDEDSHFASEYNFGGGSLTSDMEYDFSALAKQSQAEARPTMSAEAALQSSLQDETSHVRYDRAPRDPDAIYNVARSGPATGREYNPLVELSWKDLQNVYNFSVASLKDYARTGVLQSDPVKHRMDPALGSVSMPGAAPPAAGPSSTPSAKQAEPPLRQPYPEYDMGPSTNDPNRTGDRLQALSDPRNLFDTDAVVDLDALDIFDDLDDYVDLDKIEIINDVQTQPKQKDKPIGAGGDELRELIKGRIKQAAEMPHEQAPPKSGMGVGLGGGIGAGLGAGAAANKDKDKDKDKEAGDATTSPPGGMAGALKGGGARNKFVGSAKTGQENIPAPAASSVIKQLPADIRKSCLIIGIKPEELTTRDDGTPRPVLEAQKLVSEKWKDQIASPGVHPDHGGDTETAVYLNTAKDTLVRWLEAQAPKLGKKFGGGGQAPPKGPDKDKQ